MIDLDLGLLFGCCNAENRKTGIWDFFEIYIPLLVSDNLYALAGSFKNRIRFVFRLDKINSRTFK